jgi:DNA-3-methyladenine glycosylase II
MIKKLDNVMLLEGIQALTSQDRHLAAITAAYGPSPLWDRDEGYHTLINIILEQQVSLASAQAAYSRLEKALGTITPEGFLQLSDGKLKEIGFSRQKTLYGRELAKAIVRGDLNLPMLAAMEDEKAKNGLMKIKGIGSWTADIYLIMALGRPDIWPGGDIALASAYQRTHGLPYRPKTEELNGLSEKWRPWRSVAARLLWHFYLSEKQAKT